MSKREQKEVQIYQSVLRLWQQGAELHRITVQQIADEAQMGKGTVYEYFTSREEIIAQALMYCINNMFEKLEESLAKAIGFEKKIQVLLDAADKVFGTQVSGVQFLFACLQGGVLSMHLCQAHKNTMKNRMHQNFCAMVQAGIAEGVINAQLSMRRAEMAVLGIVIGFSQYLENASQEEKKHLREDAVANIYKILS